LPVFPSPGTTPTIPALPGATGSSTTPGTGSPGLPSGTSPGTGSAIPPVFPPADPISGRTPALPGSPDPGTLTDPRPPSEGIPPAIVENGGKQESSVTLEWIGSPTAKVNVATDYTLQVRNNCNIPVQQVQVRVRMPNGMQVQAAEPKPVNMGDVMVWDLNTLSPHQDRSIVLKMVATAKGEVAPQAWVTFTGSSVMHIKIREPKLTMKASAPEKVLVGDAVAFTIAVTNPGDGAAEGVKIHAVLSEGLEHARGNKMDFEIGNLAAGETRSVQVICAAKSGGVQKCESVVEAEGLKASDSASVNVIKPHLELQVVGPAVRYLDRKALYSLKVTNPGDAPATNVTVSHMVPVGFKVLAADNGGRHDSSTRTVSWFLGEVAPGQTREVKLEVLAINPGEHKHKAVAFGARGLRSEAELSTRVQGLAAMLVELVDTEDPIEVGAETTYEVRITNTGSSAEGDIRLVGVIPDKMELKSIQGPVRYHTEGKNIIFEPLEKLQPRADALFRIRCKGLEAGIVRFKIQVTSATLAEPLIKQESTVIYADAPEQQGSALPAHNPLPQE
jgi:uncharacterized repeat protein (TIGR01451 family)